MLHMPFLYSFLGFNLLVQLASALLFTDVLYGWLHGKTNLQSIG